MPDNSEYLRLLGKARDAKHGGQDAWSVMSTGEKVTVALVLNQHEWLQCIGYTIPEAIDRAGMVWVSWIPKVAQELAKED